MYTSYPLVDQFANTHAGFYIILFLCLCVLLGIWLFHDGVQLESTTVFAWTIFFIGVIIYAHNESYNYVPKVYKNTPVIGTLIGFESGTVVNNSGKHTNVKSHTYVIYKVENSRLMLNAGSGVAYPEVAQFYKN